ncbi:MAG: hypothetical protein R2826_09925 [Thermoleophilia bacterium]
MVQEDTARLQDEMPGPANKELEVVAYLGDFKIVGMAHFGRLRRTSSRRPSDYIRQFEEARLTLANVRIYGRGTQELLDEAPFVIVNMDKIDFMYAREEAQERA